MMQNQQNSPHRFLRLVSTHRLHVVWVEIKDIILQKNNHHSLSPGGTDPTQRTIAKKTVRHKRKSSCVRVSRVSL